MSLHKVLCSLALSRDCIVTCNTAMMTLQRANDSCYQDLLCTIKTRSTHFITSLQNYKKITPIKLLIESLIYNKRYHAAYISVNYPIFTFISGKKKLFNVELFFDNLYLIYNFFIILFLILYYIQILYDKLPFLSESCTSKNLLFKN